MLDLQFSQGALFTCVCDWFEMFILNVRLSQKDASKRTHPQHKLLQRDGREFLCVYIFNI